MKRIKKHLSFANVMSAFAVFVVLGGSAYALGKNTVGSKQLKKNAVTAAKIKKNAVTTAKIKNGSVTGAKLAEGSVTGTKVDVASLGKVPSASTADTATSATTAASAQALAGQSTQLVRLAAGEQKQLIANGSVSLTATCTVNDGGQDYVRILAATTAAGAVMDGDFDALTGGANPADFLNPGTPADDRVFNQVSISTGDVNVESAIDGGIVMGPDGKGVVANTEGVVMGLNYAGSDCLVGGVFNAIG